MTDEIHRALESAVTASVDNMEKIKGRTLIAVDVSGSMSSRVSAKSDIRCADIASLLGAMANKLCEDATVCYFEASKTLYREYYRRRGMQFPESMYKDSEESGYRIAHYGKYDSVLEIALQNSFAGWSDRVLSFINLAEAGVGSMVKEVENYNKTEKTV